MKKKGWEKYNYFDEMTTDTTRIAL